jgi:hypothetical protein
VEVRVSINVGKCTIAVGDGCETHKNAAERPVLSFIQKERHEARSGSRNGSCPWEC